MDWIEHAISGVAALIGAGVGAGTVLYVNHRQRETDRRVKRYEERRDLYARFIGAMNELAAVRTEFAELTSDAAVDARMRVTSRAASCVGEIQLVAPPRLHRPAIAWLDVTVKEEVPEARRRFVEIASADLDRIEAGEPDSTLRPT